MREFNYINLTDNYGGIDFVANSKKFSKRETMELFLMENKNY